MAQPYDDWAMSSESLLAFEDWLDFAYSSDEQSVLELHSGRAWDFVARDAYAEYLIRSWEDPQRWLLDRYSLKQIGTGLWRTPHVYANHDLPRELRLRGWVALRTLFRKVFTPLVSDSLAIMNELEMPADELNMICYMWWDMASFHYRKEGADDIDRSHFLALCRECLFSPRPVLQESAIHGLGHACSWEQSFPPARELLEEYLIADVAARPELVAYAREVLTGEIL